ncbi:MAG TPA: hypothetical protein VFD70_16380 [Anaerolineae bacterium]|nr:hypothetical protein [Anaerolineae bacterium]
MVALLALLLEFLGPPTAALAHPLDVYLQATYITVAPSEIIVELDLSPGVLVAPNVLPQLDTNTDQQISDSESQAYADTILHNIALQVDGKPLALSITKIDMPEYLTIQAGYGTIRIFTTAALPNTINGIHTIYYKNSYAPTGSAYQVNTFVEQSAPITLGKQIRDSIQQSITVDYTLGAPAPSTNAPSSSTAPSTTAAQNLSALATQFSTQISSPDQARQLFSYLNAPTLSPAALLLALSLAVALGALHALTPGHGKTLAAAYLVGSRGTVRHAVALGSIVTFTHTSSVIIIGLLALFASQFIVPNVLVPILTILSGLLVVLMGARLVWQRWTAFRHPTTAPNHSQHHVHPHDDPYPHDHTHAHDPTHTHDHHAHTHLPPADGIKVSNLLAMGVSGGLVPCPEALGIMVIAIGLNRILLGLGLIVSFSFGLAAVLIIIGILLVRSRALVERVGGVSNRWSRALPLISAVIVTVLGIGITISGLATYFG